MLHHNKNIDKRCEKCDCGKNVPHMNLFMGWPALAIDAINCSFRWLSDCRFISNSANSQAHT